MAGSSFFIWPIMAAVGLATLAPGLDRLASSAPGGASQVPNRSAIARGPDGQFYLDGRVGNLMVRFLVDPDASGTTLSGIDAARLGLDDESAAMLPALAIGRETQPRVAVRIGADLPVSTLGRDALARFASIGVEGDRLVLR